MFDPDQYQLLDFGKGEKLEVFGGTLVRRATPSVDRSKLRSGEVNWDCSIRFRKENRRGFWTGNRPGDWRIRHNRKVFRLKPTPAGQVGLFPEQATNWSWIESGRGSLEGLSALNLFGYTGGTTLSLASQGAKVVHVDAARNVVQWARGNALDSGMAELPIHWIVEDAIRFIKRECVRGRRYDILVADPPSYGTGPRNERWKFRDNIHELLSLMVKVASPELRMVLLTCHTPGVDAVALKSLVNEHFGSCDDEMESFPLTVNSAIGDRLECGCCLRYLRN